MKNLKVAQKLLVTFVIVLLLAGAVGTVGLVGLNSMEHASEDIYDSAAPLASLMRGIDQFQAARGAMWEIILHTGEMGEVAEHEQEVTEGLNGFVDAMDTYYLSLRTQATIDMFMEIVDLVDNHIIPEFMAVIEGAKRGVSQEELKELIADADEDSDVVIANIHALAEARDSYMSEAHAGAVQTNTTMLIVIISVLVIAVFASVFLGVYVSRLISRPLDVLCGYLEDAGDKGLLEMTPEEARLIPIYAQNKDELGRTLKAAQSFFSHVSHIAEELESISRGNLTVEVEVLSEIDVLGNSLERLEDSLNSMFADINSSANQVTVGAKQVADGAQSLAQGSTEQAASIEELSASINDVAASTKVNADIATKTATLSGTIRHNAEKGSQQMDEMITAVREINEASLSISKIIKTIDDIAFQTNILALNAAVEAARAGQHGKGFAVVAEEVRNLASKSAEAAKDTGDMIQNSMTKAELGSQIAGATAESLKEIVSGISESSDLISQIAQASEDQSVAISQINTGIDQVAQVVQQNSATAQQSAAASQQMSGQSDMLQTLISQFKLKSSSTGYSLPSKAAKQAEPMPTLESHDAPAPSSNEGGSFGKY